MSKASAVSGKINLRFCLTSILIALGLEASLSAAQQGPLATVVRADTKSGRLVRSVVMEPRAIPTKVISPQPLAAISVASTFEAAGMKAEDPDLERMIDRIADEQGVETHLVHSVIQAESNYNAKAISAKGAQGMMQLIPSTARRFGVVNSFDARQNIQGGVRYLRFLLDYYQGDYPKTIAAYNAGEKAVDKYHGIPPYAETQNYVYQVARHLKTSRQAFAHRPFADQAVGNEVSASVRPLRVNGETPSPIQASTGSDGRIYYRTP